MLKAVLVDYDPDLFDINPPTLSYMQSKLEAVGATLEIGQRRTEEAVIDMAGGADLVMIQSVRPLLSDRVIRGLTRCRGIIRLGLGYDSVDIAAATDAGIPVSNVVDWCTDEVAEHAIALLLAAARRLTPLNQMVRSGGWERDAAVRMRRIKGQTLGIIGFGRVGREVSQRMGAFGLSIIVYHPRQDAEAISRYGARKVALDDLLQSADWITLHLPLTEETYHMIGPRELGLMKDGVILVNTARGAVIDESALVDALRSGKIGAAGLDVMEREPLPADSALRQFSNVTFTTHVASYSQEAVETLYRFGAEIGADMLSAKWVSTIVNPDVRGKAEARWGAFADGSEQ